MQIRIGTLSELTGVSIEGLRAWERRYGLLNPERTAGGFRLYGDEDVARVRGMQALLGAGMSASEAARQVLGSGHQQPAEPAPDQGTPLNRSEEALHRAFRSFDAAALEQVIDRIVATFDLDTAIRELFVPALRQLGEDWVAGSVSVAQEHFSVSVLRSRVMGLARGWDLGAGPRVLLACPAGELHDLSLALFGLALHRRGWRVTFLGANTPVDEVMATVDEISPRIAVLYSANWAEHAASITAVETQHAQVALAGVTAGPIAERYGLRWLKGDPVTAAVTLTDELGAFPAHRGGA